jgi:5-methyltetrahydrofolate--homocysteine methyltransferase
MGTMIQRFKLGEAQYRGEGYAGADGAGERFKDFPATSRATTSCCR